MPRKPSAFVNLYNNEWNTNFPEWQEGSWTSRVRLWLIARDCEPRAAPHRPLLGSPPSAARRRGRWPGRHAAQGTSRPEPLASGVLVTAFGQNPDGDGTLLRVWEQSGESGKLVVDLPAGYKSAVPVNLRGEQTGKSIAVKDGRLSLELTPMPRPALS